MISTFLFQVVTFLQPAGASPAGGSAPAAPPQGPIPGCGGGEGGMSSLLMLAVMFLLLYFLMIRPQQKKAKQHQDMLAAVKKGDRVITNGGLIGNVSGITDRVVTLEVASNVRVQVLKSQIAGHDKADEEKKP